MAITGLFTSFALAAVPCGLPALSTQQPSTPSRPAAATRPASRAIGRDERVWDGYLFRDKEGKIEIGTPVIAMGVMSKAPQWVGGELGRRLDPLLCAADENWLFVNYTLEDASGKGIEKLPRYLVTLAGQLDKEPAEDGRISSRGTPETLTHARLIAVETLPPDWYRSWALFFRDPCSPFRVARRQESDKAAVAAFATAALAALQKMRAVPGPDAAEIARLRAIEPGVAIIDKYRRRAETAIQRWLVEEAKKNGWELPGLETLGPLPPASTEIQGWFLGSKSRDEFLARVTTTWRDPADHLVLVHYEDVGGGSTTWAETELWQVRERWSDADFVRHQRTTHEILGRR